MCSSDLLDGSDYGLVGRSFSQSVANASVKLPLFNNGLRFTFKVSEGFNLSQLGDAVRFQYGTSLDEPSFDVDPPPSAPEPSTLALVLIAGLLAVGQTKWRKGRLPQVRWLETETQVSH